MDGAIFFNFKKTEIGAIVRDHRGKALFATRVAENAVAQPELIEAIAVLRGLQLCLNQGFTQLLIENECLLLVMEILQRDPSNSVFENIVFNIKELSVQIPFLFNCAL